MHLTGCNHYAIVSGAEALSRHWRQIFKQVLWLVNQKTKRIPIDSFDRRKSGLASLFIKDVFVFLDGYIAKADKARRGLFSSGEATNIDLSFILLG